MPLATPTRAMPLPERLRDFLGDLLGQAVAVDKAKPPDLADDELRLLTGVFVDDAGAVIGACLADIELAARCGAALAMIPKSVADETIATGALTGNLRDNFYEVANIATGLLNGPSVAHLRITEELVDGVPDEVRDLVLRAAGRRAYRVTIGGYGGGTLALYAA